MTDRVALLRGINVGGRNEVRMADLRAAMEALGGEDVATYIASGNVLYRGALGADELEPGLSRHFGLDLKVVVRTAAQVRRTVVGAPDGFGWEDHHCDVVFLRPSLTARQALGALSPRDGVDRAWAGAACFYHARLSARRTSSRFGQITRSAVYGDMTIRSWSTVRKLDELLRARSR